MDSVGLASSKLSLRFLSASKRVNPPGGTLPVELRDSVSAVDFFVAGTVECSFETRSSGCERGEMEAVVSGLVPSPSGSDSSSDEVV